MIRFFGVFVLFWLVAELLTIVAAAKILGGGLTILLLLGGFFGGSYLLRGGRGKVAQLLMAGALARSGGAVSLYQMLWPVRIPFAGLLLMIPGFASDFLALLLLLPFKGKPLSGQQQSATFGNGAFHYESRRTYSGRQDDDDIIEGEFTVRDDKNKPSEPHNNLIEHK